MDQERGRAALASSLTIRYGHFLTEGDFTKDTFELGLIDAGDEPPVDIGIRSPK